MNPRSLRQLLFATLLAASSGAHAADEQQKVRTFGEGVGVVGKFSQGQSLDTLPMLRDLRVRWVREHVGWSLVEPAPGAHAALPANLRQQLAYYKANDIGLVALLTLSRAPKAPATPEEVAAYSDPDAFGRFAAHVARQLKAEGVRFVLQVGNEPHNSHLPRALGGQWNGRPPSPWLDHYVRMVNAAVREVKAVDPTVRVLAGDDMWVIDYWMLEAGLDPRLDGLTVHPYASLPEVAAVAHDTDWVQPFVAVDPDRSLQSAIARLRDAALRKQGRPVEIWITEMGWPVSTAEDPAIRAASERLAAAYLPRAFVLAAESGVEAFTWFSSQDGPDGPMGVTRNDRSRRPAYDAFRTMTAQLGATTFVRRLVGARGTAATTQALLFTDGRADVVVAWNAKDARGADVVVRQQVPGEVVVTDFLGNRKAVPRARDGQLTVPVGPEPVYVRMPAGTRTALGTPRERGSARAARQRPARLPHALEDGHA